MFLCAHISEHLYGVCAYGGESCYLSFVSVRGRMSMGMWVGAGCVWVVQLRVEWLSEMTVINSFTLGPADNIINHIYWWCVWLTYLWVSVVPLQQPDTSYTRTANWAANICQLVMYLATYEQPIPHWDRYPLPPWGEGMGGGPLSRSELTLRFQVEGRSQSDLSCPTPGAENKYCILNIAKKFS